METAVETPTLVAQGDWNAIAEAKSKVMIAGSVHVATTLNSLESILSMREYLDKEALLARIEVLVSRSASTRDEINGLWSSIAGSPLISE